MHSGKGAKKMRKVQKLVASKWVDVVPEKVKPGDIIRLFEPDGRPVRIKDWPTAGQSQLRVTEVVALGNGHFRFKGEPA
jgi:hypothetical protein